TSGDARAIEDAVAADEPVLCAGLARFDLRQERRSLRLLPRAFAWRWTDDADTVAEPMPTGQAGNPERRSLHLAFELPSGTFATAVIAAFCTVEDAGRTG